MPKTERQRRMLEEAGQLSLFAVFDTPVRLPSPLPVASNDDEGDDDELVSSPVIHRVIRASEAEPIEVKGPSSVFDMAVQIKLAPSQSKPRRLSGVDAVTRVHREFGRIRCERIQVVDTPEWQEKEAARRARQIVPRPPKQSFRVGKDKVV